VYSGASALPTQKLGISKKPLHLAERAATTLAHDAEVKVMTDMRSCFWLGNLIPGIALFPSPYVQIARALTRAYSRRPNKMWTMDAMWI
jgi:hypothetical protein